MPEYSILLVEDEVERLDQLREPLVAVAEHHPEIRFKLTHVDSQGAAIDQIRRNRHDLVILDLRIRPYITAKDGIRVLEVAERFRVPVIIVSVLLSDDDVERYKKTYPAVVDAFMRQKARVEEHQFAPDRYVRAVLNALSVNGETAAEAANAVLTS